MSTTTLELPLRFDPDLTNPDLYPVFAIPEDQAAGSLPPRSEEEELAFVVVDSAGWHGQGHEILAAWDAGGIIDGEELGQGAETLMGCAEHQLFRSHQILERAAEARSTLILAGVPEAKITPRSVATHMTIDDPATLGIDPVEYKFFFLICGGTTDEQARAIASM